MTISPFAACTFAAMTLTALAAAAGDETPPVPPRCAERTVRFASGEVTLVGTLATPDAGGRHAAIVLLHGSERGRRDNAVFRALRERLCAEGLAVLSFDRRGVGESGGVYSETPDLRVPAGDGIAAVRFLAGLPEVDSTRIGALGISQGGWVAPLMAARSSAVAFVVAVSGPGVSPFEQSQYQRATNLREAGLASAEIESVNALRTILVWYWRGTIARPLAELAWEVARHRPWLERASATDELFSRIGRLERVPRPEEMPEDFVRSLGEQAFYDPIPTAERLRAPILHLFGAKDRHIPVGASVAALEAAYARSGHGGATIRVLPEAGHSMQLVAGPEECLECMAEARRNGTATWTPAPGWLDTLAAWLRPRVARPPR